MIRAAQCGGAAPSAVRWIVTISQHAARQIFLELEEAIKEPRGLSMARFVTRNAVDELLHGSRQAPAAAA
jgi:hypothetical protein